MAYFSFERRALLKNDRKGSSLMDTRGEGELVTPRSTQRLVASFYRDYSKNDNMRWVTFRRNRIDIFVYVSLAKLVVNRALRVGRFYSEECKYFRDSLEFFDTEYDF